MGVPILSIHINLDMNVNIHIDINMNIDITQHPYTPCRGRPQTGPERGMGWGGGGDINIHIDINMNIDVHIIISMNIECYIDYYTLVMPTLTEKIKISTNI